MTGSITPNISLKDLTESPLAKARGFSNLPQEETLPNLIRLAGLIEQVLHLLGPIHVKFISGYQSPRLQAAMGADTRDAAAEGRAMDFQTLGMELHQAFDQLAVSDVPFDILACQWKRNGLGWLHITVPPEGQEPRRILHRNQARPRRVYLS